MERLELDQKAELLKRGFTRRSFGRIATILTAGTTLPFYNEAALAQRATSRRSGFEIPPDAVRINGNENPAGPCPEAADAIHSVIQNGGRYGFTEAFQFSQSAADIESVKQDHVMVFAGSSDPLPMFKNASFANWYTNLVVALPRKGISGSSWLYGITTI